MLKYSCKKTIAVPLCKLFICLYSAKLIPLYGNWLLLCQYLRKATDRMSVTTLMRFENATVYLMADFHEIQMTKIHIQLPNLLSSHPRIRKLKYIYNFIKCRQSSAFCVTWGWLAKAFWAT